MTHIVLARDQIGEGLEGPRLGGRAVPLVVAADNRSVLNTPHEFVEARTLAAPVMGGTVLGKEIRPRSTSPAQLLVEQRG